jgi:cytochrome c biogenesis protein CcmG/thiol:disulfide interchange protein DsbE
MTKKNCGLNSIFTIVATISLLVSCIGCVVPVGSQVGDNAPDFTLSTLDGSQFQLSAVKGKPVLLSFWTTGCGACIYQMPFLESARDEMGDEVEFITVDIMEDSYTVQALMNYYDFSLPVALDNDGTITESYNVIYTPTNVVIDEQGVIYYIRKGAFLNTDEILAIFNDLE